MFCKRKSLWVWLILLLVSCGGEDLDESLDGGALEGEEFEGESSSETAEESESENSTEIESIPPTANAGVNVVSLLGEIVNLDAAQSSDGDGSVSSYRWELANYLNYGIEISETTSANVSFTVPAEYFYFPLRVNLTVTDNDGGLDTDSVLIAYARSVSVGPEHICILEWNDVVCYGEYFDLAIDVPTLDVPLQIANGFHNSR